ncbi:MAG: hypothetical protein AB7G88_00615 [Thermomicrobiales bacterium]
MLRESQFLLDRFAPELLSRVIDQEIEKAPRIPIRGGFVEVRRRASVNALVVIELLLQSS